MQKRYLTVEQAEARLPKLRRLLRKLIKIENSLDLAEGIDIEYDEFFEFTTQQIRMNKTYHKLWFDYYKTLEGMHTIGAIIKDIRNGVVDFYSLHDGREIFLCWHYGEDSIKYWHEVDGSYSGRKPVSLLKKTRNV